MSRQPWRIWGTVLLVLALIAQFVLAKDLIRQLEKYWSETPNGYKVAGVLYLAAAAATVVTIGLVAAGKRTGGLIAASITLGLALASIVGYMVSDLTNSVTLIESIKSELLGYGVDDSGNVTFWPSIAVAGIPTWLLLAAAILVLAVGRRTTASTAPAELLAAGSAQLAPVVPAANSTGDGETMAVASDGVPAVATGTQSAGWYPNPAGQGPNLYWDGLQWLTPVGSVTGAAGSGVPQTSTTAVIALVMAFVLWPVGLVLGYVARKEIDNSNGAKTGRGLATAAIVLGWIGVAVAVLGIVLIVVAASQGGHTT